MQRGRRTMAARQGRSGPDPAVSDDRPAVARPGSSERGGPPCGVWGSGSFCCGLHRRQLSGGCGDARRAAAEASSRIQRKIPSARRLPGRKGWCREAARASGARGSAEPPRRFPEGTRGARGPSQSCVPLTPGGESRLSASGLELPRCPSRGPSPDQRGCYGLGFGLRPEKGPPCPLHA